jgi:hypothetical protein
MPSYIQLQKQNKNNIPTSSGNTYNLFVDSSDGFFKFKNDSGNTFNLSNDYESVTYSELVSKITGKTLTAGKSYLITNYKTCYDQPDFLINGQPVTGNTTYKQGPIEPIIVFALSANTISSDGYQPKYPKDKIKYDYTFSTTEKTGGQAFGRIIERIDEYNNRTDYDHRNIYFKRYESYSYKLSDILPGTIQVQSNGVVVGNTGTTFSSSLTVGDVIAIPSMGNKYFEVLTISGSSGMTITGLSITTIGSGTTYYSTINDGFVSHKRNNISLTSEEYTTFNLTGVSPTGLTIFNNYIGDYSIYHLYDSVGNFILPNNVFKGNFDYYQNTFGNVCYNNTFDNHSYSNSVGDYFRNNITNDNFEDNFIGNLFEDNYITSNFRKNQIGYEFARNTILSNNFNDSIVKNSFTDNTIISDFYDNNIVANSFQNNIIRTDFQLNNVLCQLNNTTFTGSISVSGSFNKNILQDTDGNNKLFFISGNTLIITGITN